MALTALPSDVLILVLRELRAPELAALARACRCLNNLVKEFGWAGYLHTNPRPSFSLFQARQWSAATRVRYDTLTDSAWTRAEFIARPLSRLWLGKLQPSLAISSSRLAVAAGSNIYLYRFAHPRDEESPAVQAECTISLQGEYEKRRDITKITFVDDSGLDQTLYVAFQDGALERLLLIPSTGHDGSTSIRPHSTTIRTPTLPEGDFLEGLSSQRNIMLSLSSIGRATLHDTATAASLSSSIALEARSWASHLSLSSSTPFAAFGTSSTTPLTIHAITNDQLSPSPLAILHTASSLINPESGRQSSSAVYGITNAPLGSPWGASPQLIVAGWFDGQVRCYDLRSSSRTTSPYCTNGPAHLRPVLSLADPRSDEAIYSVSCGGGSASHIAAGLARHSMVSFWDIRSPKAGWSVYAPGNDSSPVYSLILESSRMYGATQSRPFVYDFGPGVGVETYPSLPPGIDGLKRKKTSGGLGCYVTKYRHSTGNDH